MATSSTYIPIYRKQSIIVTGAPKLGRWLISTTFKQKELLIDQLRHSRHDSLPTFPSPEISPDMEMNFYNCLLLNPDERDELGTLGNKKELQCLTHISD